MSYGLMWENKHLIVFPIISTLSAALVFLSFALLLWQALRGHSIVSPDAATATALPSRTCRA